MKVQLEQASENIFLMSFHPLTNFEIQKYHRNEPKFNGVYSRNNLSKIRDGAYIINLDEYKSIRTCWTSLYVNAKNVTYSDSFGVEHIPKEIRKFNRNKNIITNLYRIVTCDSIMCKYISTGFIGLMLKSKKFILS